MRNCLAVSALLLMMSCAGLRVESEGEKFMSETIIKDVRVALAGPQKLPLSAALRGGPAYDGPRNFFTVSLTNESRNARTLPFDELRRNIVRIYRNPDMSTEIIDNRTPPPKLDGSVEQLAPGETKTFQVVFDYPASIATMTNHVALLRFCIKWESDWLRKSAYQPGSYDWNESFELCHEIRVIDE